MIDTSTPPLPSPGIKPEQPAQGITHARQARQPPPPQPPKLAPVAIAQIPLRSSFDGRQVLAQVPLAWSSIKDHQPAVNISITRLLFSLQQVSDTYEKWGKQEVNAKAVKNAFNELVGRWNEVEDAFSDCCMGVENLRDVQEGMNIIKRLCGSTLTHDGPNWVLMREAQPVFQETVRERIINGLKAKSHRKET